MNEFQTSFWPSFQKPSYALMRALHNQRQTEKRRRKNIVYKQRILIHNHLHFSVELIKRNRLKII